MKQTREHKCGVDDAVAVETRVVDAPTAVVDAAVVAVHSLELV